MEQTALDTVKEMWIAYREQGVEVALQHLHPNVEFVAEDGVVWEGHDGVREFFERFESRGRRFSAAPYTFEPLGRGVVVVGHRRIRSADGQRADAENLYFSHRVDAGLITRLAAWDTREEAERDARAR
jgi:ketosteroid isomerase-like protein